MGTISNFSCWAAGAAVDWSEDELKPIYWFELEDWGVGPTEEPKTFVVFKTVYLPITTLVVYDFWVGEKCIVSNYQSTQYQINQDATWRDVTNCHFLAVNRTGKNKPSTNNTNASKLWSILAT